jgi:tetratricopeptide (TPR) repeat protein
VRITAQLIDARNDKHLWSETYDRDLSDVFAIQDEIAHSIVEALRLQISGTLVENETSNGLAHELYLKGLYFWNRRHAKELPQALEQFIAASREDPKYARAYAGMALTYAILPQYMEYDAAKASRLGKEAAGRALQLDPRAADAHAALCQIAAEMDHDWKGALRHCDEALKLDPQSATAHQWKGEVLGVLGQTDAGLQEFDRAIELDPLSVTAMNGRGILLFRSGRVEEAITVYKELTQRDPDYGAGRANLIISLFVGQHFDEAIRAAGSDSAIVQVIEGMKTPSLKPRAIHILSERSGKAQGYVAGFAVAFNALGQPDSAAAFLDRTADHWTPSIAYAAYDVGYEKMKPYPAYHEFLRKVHLE